MKESIDDNSFMVSFPVWLWVHPKSLHKGHIKLSGPEGQIAVPLFTDKDLASRFIMEESPESEKLSHYVPAVANTRQDLEKLLDGFSANGITHVTFDHTSRGATYYEITLVKSIIAKS